MLFRSDTFPPNLKVLGLTFVRMHPRYGQLWVLLQDVILKRGTGNIPKIEKILLGCKVEEFFPPSLGRKQQMLLFVAAQEGVKFYVCKDGMGDLLTELGPEAIYHEDVQEIDVQITYPGMAKQPKKKVTRRLPSQEVVEMKWKDLVAEKRDDACIMDFDWNSDDGDYQMSQAEGRAFMNMVVMHRYPESEDGNDSETEGEDAEVNEDLPEALDEDTNVTAEGLDGDQEDDLPPSPPPKSALKKSLEEEIWHLSHHYHEGLDGAWLGLPRHVEYDADVLLEPADFSDDDE